VFCSFTYLFLQQYFEKSPLQSEFFWHSSQPVFVHLLPRQHSPGLPQSVSEKQDSRRLFDWHTLWLLYPILQQYLETKF
jgi:hypothetical protein